MKEDLLQHIWKLKRFDHNQLHTVNGLDLFIHDYGYHNHDSGPDFLFARITIDGTLWVGHVEIHIRTSAWKEHGHNDDPAYNNVVLHVVYIHDKEIENSNNKPIHTLELKDRIAPSLINKYAHLDTHSAFVPCQNLLHQSTLDRISTVAFLDSLLVKRLKRRYTEIKVLLDKYKYDWDVVCIKWMCRNLGTRANKSVFKELSDIIDARLLMRHADSITRIESLLFGQAGFLNHDIDPYWRLLRREYKHLQRKHKLREINKVAWRFSKMRPPAFPTIRIAQLAAILGHTPRLFSALVNDIRPEAWSALLRQPCSEYWKTHFIPGRIASPVDKRLGQQTCDVILMNAFIPIIFTYAIVKGNDRLVEKTIDTMHMINAENNRIVRQWKKLGIHAASAAESQALIELKTRHCDQFKCTQCQIGTKLLFE